MNKVTDITAVIPFYTHRAIQVHFTMKNGRGKSVTFDLLDAGQTKGSYLQGKTFAQAQSDALGAMIRAGLGDEIDSWTVWVL